MQPDRQSADLMQPDRQSADLRQPDRQSADLRQPDSQLTLGSQTASDKVSWLVLSKFCIGFGQIQVVDDNAVPIWTRPFGSNGESDRKENSLRIGSDRRIRVFRPIRAEPYHAHHVQSNAGSCADELLTLDPIIVAAGRFFCRFRTGSIRRHHHHQVHFESRVRSPPAHTFFFSHTAE